MGILPACAVFPHASCLHTSCPHTSCAHTPCPHTSCPHTSCPHRASLEFLKASGMQPHILQLHDWHAAAAALLFWECYHGAGLWRPRMVLTIHNMENTGECKQDEFAASGMSGEVFATADKALDERTIGHNPERINLMKVCMGKGGQERRMQWGDPISVGGPYITTVLSHSGGAGQSCSLALCP